MTSVKLQLPPEIIKELDLPYEGIRDASAVTIAIEGISFAASLVSLAALRPRIKALAAAVRRWRLRDDRPVVTMVVKGPGIDLKLDLPRNVSTGEILDQLRPLLDRND